MKMKKILSILLVPILRLGLVLASGGYANNTGGNEYLFEFDGHAAEGLIKAFGVNDADAVYNYELPLVVHLKLTGRISARTRSN